MCHHLKFFLHMLWILIYSTDNLSLEKNDIEIILFPITGNLHLSTLLKLDCCVCVCVCLFIICQEMFERFTFNFVLLFSSYDVI